MITVTIEDGFKIALPEAARKFFHEGDEVIVTRNGDGHFVILTLQQLREKLDESFGMWADRTDIPSDGVAFVNEIRRGYLVNEDR